MRVEEFVLLYKATCGQAMVTKLAGLLIDEQTGVGATVVQECSIFCQATGTNYEIRQKTHNIAYVLSHLRSIDPADLDKASLEKNYNQFLGVYDGLKKKYLKPHLDAGKQDIILAIKSVVARLNVYHTAPTKSGVYSTVPISWTGPMTEKVPFLLAHIFMLWTLNNATHYFEVEQGTESDKDRYLYIPHPAQVVAIFRMLGIGYTRTPRSRAGLVPNMIKVGTGEGKSVILAVASALLALFNMEVSCACYSAYLSERDCKDFQELFGQLGVQRYIHYGTFGNLCEAILNKNGSIRDNIKQVINGNVWPVKVVEDMSRPHILLVDEIDVFFNKDFYGNVYSLSARLQNPSIVQLTNYLWENRKTATLESVQASPVYSACVKRFGEWGFLVESAVADMILALNTYMSHDYIVKDGRIGYKEQDGISFSIAFGYNTLFAYYHEHSQGNITRVVLDEYISLNARCGAFSYAELPKNFSCIMGVSGTLEDKELTPAEKVIMRETYGIAKETYIPSVYGENKRRFAVNGDVKIENKENYWIKISEEIKARLQGNTADTKRAVLVFFATKKELLSFSNSDAGKSVNDPFLPFQILTEEADDNEKKKIVKFASRAGQVTLLTRCFGRGTDFISYSPIVNSNGGVHVIQTFLSEQKSEEIQIMGRTARQGQEGSYSMVLLDEDLEKYCLKQPEITAIRASGVYHETLDKHRNEYFSRQYKENNRFTEVALKEHQESTAFVDALFSKDVANVKRFLGDRNKKPVSVCSRTIVLMDATGSMGGLLQKAKNTVGTMFERASEILVKNKIGGNSFQLQFVVYRDYDCLEEILQASPWTTNPEELRSFMTNVDAKGGADREEAIEIGLWHANMEATKMPLSQVILIADAPAKTPAQIAAYRNSYNGERYWASSRFGPATHWTKEVDKLQKHPKKVPVFAFYCVDNVAPNFNEIAAASGGRSAKLDVNSPSGAQQLTDVVTQEILRDVGRQTGHGDELVTQYIAKYTHTS